LLQLVKLTKPNPIKLDVTTLHDQFSSKFFSAHLSVQRSEEEGCISLLKISSKIPDNKSDELLPQISGGVIASLESTTSHDDRK